MRGSRSRATRSSGRAARCSEIPLAAAAATPTVSGEISHVTPRGKAHVHEGDVRTALAGGRRLLAERVFFEIVWVPLARRT